MSAATSRSESRVQPYTGWRRIYYLVVGCLFLGLGILGVILPVVPTTPFIILAAWAFARSSETLYSWLYNHSLFGSSLRRWDKHHVIPWSVKLVALLSMSFAFGMLYWSERPWYVLLSMALIVIWGATYILSKPSQVVGSEVAASNDSNHSETVNDN